MRNARETVSMLVPSHWKGCRGRSPPTLSTEGRDRGNWLEANEVFRVIRDMQSRKWPEALRNRVFKEQAKSEALGLRLPTAQLIGSPLCACPGLIKHFLFLSALQACLCFLSLSLTVTKLNGQMDSEPAGQAGSSLAPWCQQQLRAPCMAVQRFGMHLFSCPLRWFFELLSHC